MFVILSLNSKITSFRIKWIQGSLFQLLVQEQLTGHPYAKQNKTKQNIDTELTPFTKINSKWIADLNVKHKTIELLGDNIRENLDDLGFDNNFLDTLKA